MELIWFDCQSRLDDNKKTQSLHKLPKVFCWIMTKQQDIPILKLCPLRSPFIYTTTPILSSTHCWLPNKRSQSQRPHHAYTETTALASHPMYRIQNLPPHISYPLWNLSTLHVIHGYAMFCFQLGGLLSSTQFAQIWSLAIVHSWSEGLENETVF